MLAGIDPRVDADAFVAATWAIIVDAPDERLQKLEDRMILAVARADPERAREDWGLRPEHQKATQGLIQDVNRAVPSPKG